MPLRHNNAERRILKAKRVRIQFIVIKYFSDLLIESFKASQISMFSSCDVISIEYKELLDRRSKKKILDQCAINEANAIALAHTPKFVLPAPSIALADE